MVEVKGKMQGWKMRKGTLELDRWGNKVPTTQWERAKTGDEIAPLAVHEREVTVHIRRFICIVAVWRLH